MPAYYNLHETYRMRDDLTQSDCSAHWQGAPQNEEPRRIWTIAEIKAELPSVPVRMTDMGTEYTGTLAGRKCPFPQVTITIKGTHVHLEAAWETVQHVLNVGTWLLA